MKSLSMPHRSTVIASILLLIVTAIVIGLIVHTRSLSHQVVVVVPPKPVTPPPAAVKPPVVDRSIGIVHAGQGVEHALIRQLMANPSTAGFQGNSEDKSELKQWAGHEAHILALKAGYIGSKFGEEIRVRHPDAMAYVIEKDSTSGNLQIVEYSTLQVAPPSATQRTNDENAAGFVQIASHGVAASIATAQFIGPQNGTTVLPAPCNTYEYMYVG
jgi:hypothetical protein